MHNVYGESAVMSWQSIYKRIQQFNTGRMETHDKEHSHRQSNLVNDGTIAIVQTLLQ